MPEGDTIAWAANRIRPMLAGRVPDEYGYEPTALAEIRPGCYDIHARIKERPEFCHLANLPTGKQPPVRLHAIFQEPPRLLTDAETTAHSAAFDAAT